MTESHSIRLAYPWRRRVGEHWTDRVRLPDPHAGVAIYQRSFNVTFDLDTHRVWLVVDALPHPAPVTVNDIDVGQVAGDKPLDVTAALGSFNRLMLRCDGGLIGPVRLQIAAR